MSGVANIVRRVMPGNEYADAPHSYLLNSTVYLLTTVSQSILVSQARATQISILWLLVEKILLVVFF